ncbi:MAG: substrate-binding domain-containing protein [Propionicimonas sp.]
MLFTAEDDAEEVRIIQRMCAQSLASEFVLTDTHPADERTGELVDQGIRFVAFGRPWGAPEDEPPHAWVDVDGRAGTADATQALASAGYRRIGFLGWPADSPTGEDRRAGWAEVLRQAGCSPAELEQLTVRTEDHLTAAIAAAPRLLELGVDAVVCASDSLAVGMVTAIGRAGADIPVVGFDNTALAASFGFSSIDQQLGAVAREILAALEQPADEPGSLLVEPRLITRSDPRWGIHTAVRA